ncbi:hypothetical protein PybrP1_000796, partial [[Pythium] brassicae (nom. inval.)]
VAKVRALRLHEVRLPVGLPAEGAAAGGAAVFVKTTQVFNSLPHILPPCVLAAFLNIVRVLYRETNLAMLV